ncbi:Type III secretion system lipoprotein chaperone (YscW) [Kushneria avicenniae]|uniref:Type III secretion system lipoprotein chaperone (YscW) n=1 Tax=Kushneria avicenniae TaxID=402385 RepID=A0A1I1MT92_9GAMM|nr:YbaY family lipoprotein [Kushneria avicenniae]SFC86428.1 Type III secretion system lipoprotein chaperone (YscW) [Kushneria avicenniae]
MQRRRFPALPAMAPLVMMTLLSGCSLFSSGPDFATLSGEAFSDEQAPIASDARLDIRLLDVTDGRTTVAQVDQNTHGRWPVPFMLQYDRHHIDDDRRYALSAALREGDDTRYLTLEPLPVLTDGAPSQQVRVPLTPVNR